LESPFKVFDDDAALREDFLDLGDDGSLYLSLY